MSSVTGHAHGSGAAKSSTKSVPVSTATTPGIATAALVSIDAIRGVRDGATDHAHVQRAGEVEVVHEAGLAGEERRVLLAERRDAEHTGAGARDGGHRPPPALSAAASTDFTMLW